MYNHWAITLNALRSLVATANGWRASTGATAPPTAKTLTCACGCARRASVCGCNLAARILHLEGLSHSRRTDQGLKQHQVRNLQQLKERWQEVLDTEQPPDGMPWLLAADRELLGRPLALLLQPAAEDETICHQRGWVPLVLRDDWPLEWLMDHLTGPLLPEIALVAEGSQLPQRPIHGPARLPALPGWDRELVPGC
jgi:hypothetical protein